MSCCYVVFEDMFLGTCWGYREMKICRGLGGWTLNLIRNCEALQHFPTHLRLVIPCLVTCQDGQKRPEYPRKDDWNDQELTVLVLSSKPSDGACTILQPRNLTWIPKMLV